MRLEIHGYVTQVLFIRYDAINHHSIVAAADLEGPALHEWRHPTMIIAALMIPYDAASIHHDDIRQRASIGPA